MLLGHGVVELAGDRLEHLLEGIPHRLQGGDARDRDQCRDQAVLDGRGARLVVGKLAKLVNIRKLLPA